MALFLLKVSLVSREDGWEKERERREGGERGSGVFVVANVRGTKGRRERDGAVADGYWI